MKPKRKNTPSKALQAAWKAGRTCDVCGKIDVDFKVPTDCNRWIHKDCTRKMLKKLLLHGSRKSHCRPCFTYFCNLLTDTERSYVSTIVTPLTDPLLFALVPVS